MSQPDSKRGFEAFRHGLQAPWRGAKLLRQRRDLWGLALGPSILLFLMFVTAVWAAVAWSAPVTHSLMPWIVRWPTLDAVITTIVGGVLAMAFGTFAYMLGALFAIPFNDELSARVEAHHYDLPAPMSVREALPMSIQHSVLGFGLWLLIQVMLLPLQGLPGVGSLLDLVLGITVTAFFLAHQLMDGPMTRWRYSFREKLDFLWEHFPFVVGLGCAGTLLLAVPGLNAVGLPIGVAGGALLFAELNPATAGRRRHRPPHPE